MACPIQHSQTPANRRVSTRALSASLGVSDRTVRRWTERGCPSLRTRRKGGRPAHLFDPLEVKAWLVANGITPKLDAAADPAGADASASPPDLDPGATPGDGSAAQGFEGMHARLTIAERVTFAAWVSAVKDRRHEAGVQARARQWRDTADALRKVEKDVAGIRRDRTDWIARAEVDRFLERIGEEVRTRFIGIPAAVTPLLVGQKAPRIQSILTGAIRDVLSHLSKAEIGA